FAFASGGTYTEIDDCLDRLSYAPSSWDPACFEVPLFLRDLVARTFPIVVDGRRLPPSQRHLAAVVSHPPDDPEIVRFRQAVLRELAARPELRRALERLYARVRRFKELLGPHDANEEPDIGKRRLSMLRTAHEAIAILAGEFDGAESGLTRLAE